MNICTCSGIFVICISTHPTQAFLQHFEYYLFHQPIPSDHELLIFRLFPDFPVSALQELPAIYLPVDPYQASTAPSGRVYADGEL